MLRQADIHCYITSATNSRTTKSYSRRGPAHYRTAWEIKGGFDIFSKATDILIHKKPEVLSLPTAGLAEFHNYFWAVLHNLLRNLTRNKEVRLAHEIQYKTIPLTEGSFNLIESPGADTQSPDNLSKTDQIIIPDHQPKRESISLSSIRGYPGL